MEQLHDYTYRKVAGVLGECQSTLKSTNPSVGEPKFGAYETVGEALAATDPANTRRLTRVRTCEKRRLIRRRYDLPADMLDTHAHVHPVFGTKEGLFSAILAAVLRKEDRLSGKGYLRPLIVLPNPLYHVMSARH